MFGFLHKKNFTRDLCRYFQTDYASVLDFLTRGEKNYTVCYVKKNRKRRKLFSPNERLSAMQKFAVKTVFSAYPVSKFSTAYEKGCSIQKNAAAHSRGRFAAKFDIEDFFGSCRYALFHKLLEKRYSKDDIKLLWLIVSLNDGLPVGAHSSPFVANRLMYALDCAVGKEFKKLTYTRYADDMTFSSSSPLPESLQGGLMMQLARCGFQLNHKKTRKYSAAAPKKITGIFLAEKGLTVGKRYKLKVKRMLYQYTKHKKGNKNKLLGCLNHIKNTEPHYYKYLIKKYFIEGRNESKAV